MDNAIHWIAQLVLLWLYSLDCDLSDQWIALSIVWTTGARNPFPVDTSWFRAHVFTRRDREIRFTLVFFTWGFSLPRVGWAGNFLHRLVISLRTQTYFRLTTGNSSAFAGYLIRFWTDKYARISLCRPKAVSTFSLVFPKCHSKPKGKLKQALSRLQIPPQDLLTVGIHVRVTWGET